MSLVVARRGRSASSVNGPLASMVFNGTDEYLEISSFSSSSPNQTKWTFACWIRLDQLPSAHGDAMFLEFYEDANNRAHIYANDLDDGFYFLEYIAGAIDYEVTANDVVSNQWMHLCIAFDGTESGRDIMKMYLDNNEENEGSRYDRATTAKVFANGARVRIGFGLTDYVDGRIADLILIEGLALTPTDVNYDSVDGGKWKDYTGAFGTHGFRLNPQSSSEMGTDKSGNGYDFSLNNMDGSNFDASQAPPS